MYWSNVNHLAPRKIPVRGSKNGVIGEKETIVRPNGSSEAVKPSNGGTAAPVKDQTDWQTMTLRLQAEMDNFRKRQTRRVDEAVAAERGRLLALFLPVLDNLARALNHGDQTDETVRQGVELTHRELMRLLEAEGVTRLETVGHPFDPEWHEAVAVIPVEAEAGMIAEEVEAGYKLDDRLLRPAKVVVAA